MVRYKIIIVSWTPDPLCMDPCVRIGQSGTCLRQDRERV
jgi:hypothetical protein